MPQRKYASKKRSYNYRFALIVFVLCVPWSLLVLLHSYKSLNSVVESRTRYVVEDAAGENYGQQGRRDLAFHYEEPPINVIRAGSEFDSATTDSPLLIPSKLLPPAGYLVHTPECKIADIHPINPVVRSHLRWPVYSPDCTTDTAELVYLHRGFLHISTKVVEREGLQLSHCSYQPVPDGGSTPTTPTKKFTDKIPVDYRHNLSRVECWNVLGRSIYENVFWHLGNSSNAEDDWPSTDNETSEPISSRPNILIIGLGSTSRLNAIRHLWGTLSFMRQRMRAVDMHGYVTISDDAMTIIRALVEGDRNDLCFCEKFVNSNLLDIVRDLGYATAITEDVQLASRLYRDKFDYSFSDIYNVFRNKTKMANRLLTPGCVGDVPTTTAVF